MCGRFIVTSVEKKVADHIPGIKTGTWRPPNRNVCPTQEVPVIRNDGRLAVDWVRWGLIPHWAKDPKIGARMINARAETLAEKPSFRTPLQRQRCLILADGFYEWQAQPGVKTKVPHFIFLQDRHPFAFAGLWDEWHSPDGGSLRSATIITTEPNELMSGLHNRMPVILDAADHAEWLDPAPRAPESLAHLLRPFPADRMSAHPVSTLVNTPANDRPELVVPV